jgi:hypothetical protein
MSDNSLVPFNQNDLLPDMPQPVSKAPRLPRVNIVQGSSAKLIQKGGESGKYYVDFGTFERVNENLKTMRVVLIDGNLPSRSMWPFEADTGKGMSGDDYNQPWCASSNGTSPRPQFIGLQYEDWRNHEIIEIAPDCLSCPLGQWRPILMENGQPQRDPKTNKIINGKPPCQMTPQYVFWSFDLHSPFIIQASNPTVRSFFEGVNSKSFGKIEGIGSFYAPKGMVQETGEYLNLVHPAVGVHYAITMGLKYVPNNYSGTYVPTFAVDAKPMTDEEINLIIQQRTLYNQQDERGFTFKQYLNGDAYGADGEEEELMLGDGEPSGISTENARTRLGTGGPRRIGGTGDGNNAPF